MSEQGWLFLFSSLMLLLSLGVAGWLVGAGSALSFDGLFLLLTCGVVALVCGLNIKFLLKG